MYKKRTSGGVGRRVAICLVSEEDGDVKRGLRLCAREIFGGDVADRVVHTAVGRSAAAVGVGQPVQVGRVVDAEVAAVTRRGDSARDTDLTRSRAETVSQCYTFILKIATKGPHFDFPWFQLEAFVRSRVLLFG